MQKLRRFLQVSIHVFQDTANQNVRERRIVNALHHRDREKAISKPVRRSNTRSHGKKSGYAAHQGIPEKVQPGQGQSPGRHDVRHHKHGRQEAFAADIGPGNKPGHGPAHTDGDGAGSQGNSNRIQQRFIKNTGAILPVQKHLGPVISSKITGMSAANPHYLAGMHGKSIRHDGQKRQKRQQRQHREHHHQDHVLGLAPKH